MQRIALWKLGQEVTLHIKDRAWKLLHLARGRAEKRRASASSSESNMQRTALREFGQEVTLRFKDREVPLLADPHSAYVYFDPPSDAELEHYYLTEYGKDNPGYYSLENFYDPRVVEGHVGMIMDVLKRVGKEPREGLRVHEIGCAYGGVVAELSARGFAASGSDINAAAIEEGRRRKGNTAIFPASSAEALSTLGGQCDVIYASHTLEHEPRFLEVLKLCARALKPDGVLFGRVPNALYVRALLEGFALHPWADYPAHPHMLTPGSLIGFCDACGLEPLLVWTQLVEDNKWMRRHFGETWDSLRVQRIWEAIFGVNGMGQELDFVLTPAGRCEVAERVSAVRRELDAARTKEVAIRRLMADLP
jgi:2-polyprenyl-3-methyl-5-hydroxy-6-metoxy-1,4-benzoquinol methylase